MSEATLADIQAQFEAAQMQAYRAGQQSMTPQVAPPPPPPEPAADPASYVFVMRSGGVVLASGIPVHREVYADAAAYFDPYSTASLVAALKRVLYADDAAAVRDELRSRGEEVAAHYLPAEILPQWERFLSRVFTGHEAGVRDVGSQRQALLEPVGTVEES